MKHPRFYSTRRNSGQALPLFALMFLLLIAFAALAIDGALAFAYKRSLSIAVDNAALMGARQVAMQRNTNGPVGAVRTVVVDYLNDNLDPDPVSVQVYVTKGDGTRVGTGELSAADATIPAYGERRGVEVVAQIRFDTFLMHMFGQPTLTVTSQAAARYGLPGTVAGSDVVPLGVDQDAANKIRTHSGPIKLDLKGHILDNNTQLEIDTPYYPGDPNPPAGYVQPGNFIPQDSLRSLNLQMGSQATAPVLDAGSVNGNCASFRAAEESLKYWWCKGATGRVLLKSAANDAPSAVVLRDTVGVANSDMLASPSVLGNIVRAPRLWRVVVLPVFTAMLRSGEGGFYDNIPSGETWTGLESFIAVKITGVDSNDGIIEVEYYKGYITAGGLSGSNNNSTSGENMCMVCVVNLVRPPVTP